MFVAIGLWRHRRDLAKERREMALVLEAGAQPDLDYRQFAFDQQPFGEINPAPGQELNGRRAGGLFERRREGEGAQLRYLGDFARRQTMFEVLSNDFVQRRQCVPSGTEGPDLNPALPS